MKKVYPKPPREDFLTTLEAMCREKIGEVLQAVLEAEVDEFLGRIRAERDRKHSGHRDGHEDARTVTYGSHPVQFRRPRVRGSAERFDSKVLPPYRRRFEDVDKTLHELWIQGLSTRDFEPSLRALLGQATPLSGSTIFSCEQAVPRRVQNLVQAPDRKRVRVSLGRWGLSGRRPQ